MQKRTFLGNKNLIKHATAGISLSSNLEGVGTPCEDYVMQRKLEKSVKKIEQLQKDIILLSEVDMKVYRKLIRQCVDKDMLVDFLHTPFNSIIELKNYFDKWSSK